MGGNVTLDSTIGVGTTVRLEIPFRKPNRPSLRQSHSRKSFDQTVLSEASQEVIDLKAQIKLADRREDVSILIAEDNT